MPHEADAALAQRCADGDPEAWESFVRTHGPVLHAAARSQGKGADPEDVAQEVLADLLRDGGRVLRAFEGRSSLSTWLWVVAARKALAMRSAAKPGVGEIPPAQPEEPDPAETASAREEAARLRERLREFPARDRTIVSLVDLQGWEPHEAARLLGITPSHARMLLSRAHARLRESAGNPVAPPPLDRSDG